MTVDGDFDAVVLDIGGNVWLTKSAAAVCMRWLAAYQIQGNDCYVDHAGGPFHLFDEVA